MSKKLQLLEHVVKKFKNSIKKILVQAKDFYVANFLLGYQTSGTFHYRKFHRVADGTSTDVYAHQ